MNQKKIAVVVGSLRKGSWNRKVANELIRLASASASASLSLEIVEIGALPLYNEDLETDTPPAEWAEFRASINERDGVIFVTPEYNRTIPGGLKNAIDVGSRPYGKSVWHGKPAAVVSSSIGAIGGFGANHVLRQSLVFLGTPTLQHEAYLGSINKSFDENGTCNERTAGFLSEFLSEFEAWVGKFSS